MATRSGRALWEMRRGGMGETRPSRVRRKQLTKRATVVLRVRSLGALTIVPACYGPWGADRSAWCSSRRLARMLIGGIAHITAMAAVVVRIGRIVGIGRRVYGATSTRGSPIIIVI